jgi:hypothetical protein
MWVVPTSSELAGSKKSHPFFKPFTCLLLRKKRKDWEKKPRNQVFFCHQTCTDNLGSFNPTQSFPRESKFKVKITYKANKSNVGSYSKSQKQFFLKLHCPKKRTKYLTKFCPSFIGQNFVKYFVHFFLQCSFKKKNVSSV